MKLNDYEIKHNDYLRKNGAECTLFLKKDDSFPLKNIGNIALFGSAARNTIKGGTGSGEVNSRFFVTIEEGLKNAGFNITSSKWLDEYDKVKARAWKDFIKGINQEARRRKTLAIFLAMGAIMPEPEYSIPLEGEGDTAIYVLGRISGEGTDRVAKEGEILLSKTEVRDILELNSKYKNFMLVLNVGGVVDLTPVMEVKNILLMSQLGVVSGDIFADIILGKQNPSGKLTTTWSSWKDYPDFAGFGDRDDTTYNEGIYVGYRYFDTVQKKPLFPFGFGLSYTNFKIINEDFSVNGDNVSVSANVTNNGSFEGKEVIQLYVSIPKGKLDEPYQVLAGFIKTPSLKPDESAKVEIKFSLKDIAPFSTSDMAYILEAGDYILRLGTSSASTNTIGVIELNNEVTVLKVRSCTNEPSFKDFVPETAGADIPSGTKRILVNASDIKTSEVNYEINEVINERVKNMPDDDLIKLTLGAFGLSKGIQSMVGNSGFSVAGAAGQTSLEASKFNIPSMVLADGPAGVRLNRKAALSPDGIMHPLEIGIPESMQELLPGIFRWYLNITKYKPKKTDKIVEQFATALPIGTAIAQSFNTDFAYKCGDIVGFEMKLFGIHLWLAPALNIHRSIRCGRNFEYYSEDPLVSGLMTSAITKGVQSHPGCGVTIKHFCANNQEFNRTQNNSVMSERALREIYLKGFGIAIRDSKPKSVMTSYNLLNGVHTSESRALADDILRSEFGFDGVLMTDWVISGFCTEKESIHPAAHAPNVIGAGGDLFMPGGGSDFDEMKAALESGKLKRECIEVSGNRVARMADELCSK